MAEVYRLDSGAEVDLDAATADELLEIGARFGYDELIERAQERAVSEGAEQFLEMLRGS